MPLIPVLIGFFFLKLLLLLPFYFRAYKPLTGVVAVTSLAYAPLMTLLYHETTLDFFTVYFVMMLLDMVIAYFLVQRVVWKAIVGIFFADTVVIIFFFLGNG